ncbi:uncharacterized protein LACBIDRAFT_333217 [Laccaria bicolor S238N-H82]|uniref:Predicted protein n=1 Tax=Laccaria bicolor (strain S238N-H82 / ATCC MYA-4686) TaxID=486041 RepID=B0DVA0_LACBS|nr:uncharacterized protein LACBIDRAFT_333217 [Laccaria bicolor S238N-H82]EDR01541.1 predicted protein [Laccaria bicolor S238N-H82]|eukprot:XP_001887893.1 predicted protein [Laccaria bicolor S238N-H82]
MSTALFNIHSDIDCLQRRQRSFPGSIRTTISFCFSPLPSAPSRIPSLMTQNSLYNEHLASCIETFVVVIVGKSISHPVPESTHLYWNPLLHPDEAGQCRCCAVSVSGWLNSRRGSLSTGFYKRTQMPISQPTCASSSRQASCCEMTLTSGKENDSTTPFISGSPLRRPPNQGPSRT